MNSSLSSFSPSSSTLINPETNTDILSFVVSEIQMIELLLAALVFISARSLRHEARHGLPSWPIVGMLPSLLLGLRTNIYEWLTQVLSRQNGTFVFTGPCFTNLHCVVTSDPRNLEHLLKTRFPNFPKGGYFRDTVRDLLGDGIFGADDEIWRRQRKTASLEFHSAKFRQMTTQSLVELVHARLLRILEASVGDSGPIDLQDVLLRLTFDNVCMIALGVDPGCLRPGLPEIPFARAFEAATEATATRFVMPTLAWKAMRCLGIGVEGKLKESIKRVDDFTRGVIRARKKEISSEGRSDVKEGSDLLTVFMRMRDEEGKAFPEGVLRDICANFILAGRDTSSVALSWFFFLLNGNPEVEERILEEICGIMSEREAETSGGSGDFVLRQEEVKKMEYLHAALSEALRLYPSVPVDHKEVIVWLARRGRDRC